ncbi:MAG: Flp pilus assembly protein CpaB [Anaerotignaceae bacterium]
MKFFRNRTIIGILCIAFSLVICFGITPLFNKSISQKVEIVRVTKAIEAGEEITKNMVQTVEVGAYNLPSNVIKKEETVIGSFAKANFDIGDYILSGKISTLPTYENAYLYNLDGTKQAFSLTLKSFASGLSGKIQSGDIVSVIAPNYKGGQTIIPPELKYIEVISVTASSGYDSNTGEQTQEKELPTTVTLLITPEQGNILAELEAEGKTHLSLVYRGDYEKAKSFIRVQDEAIETIYYSDLTEVGE